MWATDDSQISSSIFTPLRLPCRQAAGRHLPDGSQACSGPGQGSCQGSGEISLRMPFPQKLQVVVSLLWANVTTASLPSFHKAYSCT